MWHGINETGPASRRNKEKKIVVIIIMLMMMMMIMMKMMKKKKKKVLNSKFFLTTVDWRYWCMLNTYNKATTILESNFQSDKIQFCKPWHIYYFIIFRKLYVCNYETFISFQVAVKSEMLQSDRWCFCISSGHKKAIFVKCALMRKIWMILNGNLNLDWLN